MAESSGTYSGYATVGLISASVDIFYSFSRSLSFVYAYCQVIARRNYELGVRNSKYCHKCGQPRSYRIICQGLMWSDLRIKEIAHVCMTHFRFRIPLHCLLTFFFNPRCYDRNQKDIYFCWFQGQNVAMQHSTNQEILQMLSNISVILDSFMPKYISYKQLEIAHRSYNAPTLIGTGRLDRTSTRSILPVTFTRIRENQIRFVMILKP